MKKTISFLTMLAMILTMGGAVLAPMPAAAATIVDGDLIRNPNASGAAQFDIYIVKLVGSKRFKRLILSPHVFESYAHFDKNKNGSPWDDVVTVDQTTMDSFITSDLVREINDTKVYRLSNAVGSDSGLKGWVNVTASEFTATCSYDWDSIYIINATDRDAYGAGTEVINSTCTSAYTGNGGVVTSQGKLTVTLSADTPVSGTAVGGAARMPFTKINLTATGGDVVVDQIIVERTGLGQDGAISSLDVIDASTNVPINTTSKTLNSLHQATFNDNVTVANGTTKTLILAANMASKATLASYAGETPALALAAISVGGTATTNVSLPITGNTMTINSTITIGTATVQRGSYTNATSTTIQVGKEDYTFFSFQIQAGSDEKVQFSQVKVYQEGSASLGTDVTGMALYQDGTKIADATITSAKYATFNFAAITLEKGQTAQYQVKADISDGSARTVDLGIYRSTDLLVKGMTYGYNITPTYSSTGSSANEPVLSDNQFTISNGTLQVTRTNDVAAGNVAVANDQFIGSFEFTCKGEPIDITTLTLTVASAGGTAQIEDALSGVELVDPNGNVVAGPTDLTDLTVPWTDTFTVPVGTTVYKVRADLSVNGGWATNDTLYVSFTPSAMTATGDTTGNAITASPSSSVSGNTQTVKAAGLTVTKNSLPAAGYLIVNQKNVKVASWHFDASNSGEDVRITSILWAGRGNSATNTDNFRVYVNGVAWDDPIDNGVSNSDDGAAGSTTFAFSDPIVITKGTSKDVDLYVDKDAVTSNDTENWGLSDTAASVVAYGLTTGNTIAESLTVDDGPTMTSIANGQLTVEIGDNPASGILLDGSTGNVMTKVKLSATYEDVRLDRLIVNIGDAGYAFSGGITGAYSDLSQVCLYVDGNYLTGDAAGSCKPASAATIQFDFDANDLIVTKDSTKIITIKADMGAISKLADNSPASNLADINVGLGGTDGIKTTGVQSNTEVTGTDEVVRSSTSSDMVLLNSKPVVQYSTTSSRLGAATTLSSENLCIFAYKVTAEGGDVLLYKNVFVFTTSGDNMALSDLQIKDESDNRVSPTTNTALTHEYDGGTKMAYWTVTYDNPNVSLGDDKEAILIASGASKTFKVFATVAGVAANQGETLTVRLAGDAASTSITAGFDGQNGATAFDIATAGDLYGDGATTGAGNFVWSDNFRDRSIYTEGTTAATTTAQWYNGYLVDGLDDVVSTSPFTISQ